MIVFAALHAHIQLPALGVGSGAHLTEFEAVADRVTCIDCFDRLSKALLTVSQTCR